MTFTNEQIETLKGMDWQDDRGDNLFYFGSKNHDAFFEELTQLYIMCLRELLGNDDTMESVYWEIAYRKRNESLFDFHYCIWAKNDVAKDGVIAEYDTDILGLFTEEKNDDLSEEEIIKKLSSALTLATDNLDIDRIIDLIDNNFADVSNRMREIFCENLEVDDIGECLKDDIAKDWIERNPDDAYDRAVDNMGSFEIKDKIIDYLSDNL